MQIHKRQAEIDHLDPNLLDQIDWQGDRVSESTKDSYKADVRKLNDWLERQARTVNDDSLRDYFAYLNDTAAPASVNRKRHAILKALRAQYSNNSALQAVVEKTAKDAMPTHTVSKAVEGDEILSRKEVYQLVDAASDKVGLIIEFLWTTGCRVSELIGVRTQDVEPNGRGVTIRFRGKGNKARKIRIPTELYGRIVEVVDGQDRLFETRSGHPYARQNIWSQLKRVGQKVNPDLPTNPHIFRHSRATWMLDQGISLKAVSRFLGHSSTAITSDLYIHDSVDWDELEALDAMPLDQ